MIDIDLFSANKGEVVAGTTGNTISGVEVLSQRVLVVLNTKASEPLRSQEGCSLVDMLGNSHTDSTYVYMILSSVVSEIMESMTYGEQSEDNELSNISVSNVSINGDTVKFELTVVSKSGQTYTTDATIGGY
jgi:hypothetical protein